jgi:hypothetical protein
MIDSLAQQLIANGLEPDAFTTSTQDEAIFRGEVPAGRVMQTWVNLVKASIETKYWPIIQGDPDDSHEQNQRDPASILAAAPAGNIREILQPRFQERIESLSEMIPTSAQATDMDQLATMADAAGIYSFSGRKPIDEKWPPDSAAPTRASFHTVKEQKKNPSALLLIRVEHSYDVPAYLEFGGWNDCPAPELQVAVLREWRNEYRAAPACITGDVLECAVINRPQTEAQAMKLAAEHWIFCEDIVGQGTQSIRKLAMEIWRSPKWFFWWD